VVSHLHRQNLEVWMVTGDNEDTAKHVAQLAAIPTDRVCAGMTPLTKMDKVQELQAAGHVVAFVGDGINDAPALAAADVGIAVAAGMDAAIETADIVLMKSSLRDVVIALDLSRVVMRRIGMNFAWACAYNVIGMPLAAGVLYPKVQLPPSSVSVICSSLLLRCYKPPKV